MDQAAILCVGVWGCADMRTWGAQPQHAMSTHTGSAFAMSTHTGWLAPSVLCKASEAEIKQLAKDSSLESGADTKGSEKRLHAVHREPEHKEGPRPLLPTHSCQCGALLLGAPTQEERTAWAGLSKEQQMRALFVLSLVHDALYGQPPRGSSRGTAVHVRVEEVQEENSTTC